MHAPDVEKWIVDSLLHGTNPHTPYITIFTEGGNQIVHYTWEEENRSLLQDICDAHNNTLAHQQPSYEPKCQRCGEIHGTNSKCWECCNYPAPVEKQPTPEVEKLEWHRIDSPVKHYVYDIYIGGKCLELSLNKWDSDAIIAAHNQALTQAREPLVKALERANRIGVDLLHHLQREGLIADHSDSKELLKELAALTGTEKKQPK